MRTQCPQGHELTDDNLRRRTGARAGHRECLTCHVKTSRRTSLQHYAENSPELNRLRKVRKRVRHLELTLTKTGDVIMLTKAEAVVFSGSLQETEQWVAKRFERKAPGPQQSQMPESWQRWIDLYVAEQRAARRQPGTIRTRVNHLMMFAGARPDLTPLTVTRVDLVRYMGEQNWAPRTAHSFRSTFRVFFRLLHDLGHRSDDPAKTLTPISIPRSLPRPCPDQVVVDAYSATVNPTVRRALRIASETGMRCVELARMRTSDIEGRPGELALRIVGKGNHERRVPITDELATVIQAVPTTHVFPAPYGGSLTAAHLSQLIAEALPGIWTAHTLRHRFATVAYEATRDLRVVQELLGHASPTTTAIYTKVSDDSMRRAATASRLIPAD